MIEFIHVSKQYDDGTIAVDDVSFKAPTGKITVLVGPSGCGKTTSLRMINRLIEPTSGHVLLDGVDADANNVIEMRREIGYVIQNAGLFPHRTVIDNICTVPYLTKKTDKQSARKKAAELLDVVGLGQDYAERYPWQLSGGQQQRVGVARALAADPKYMLMDEPFSAVDPIVREQLQNEFIRIQHTFAKTIVMVTHDISEALKLGDYIAVFREGGHLVQFDTPAQLLASPKNKFVADFLGASRGYQELSFRMLADHALTIRPVQSIHLDDAFQPQTKGEWMVVLNHSGQAIGWARSDGVSTCADPLISYVQPVTHNESSVKDYLDAALASPSGLVIVAEGDGKYRALASSNVFAAVAGHEPSVAQTTTEAKQ